MIRLVGELWVTSGKSLTHPWDATAYLVNGPEPTLIDCGSNVGYELLKRNLHTFGLEPRDIRTVIATHGHWDHLSGMAALREESDAKLLMHEGDRVAVETGDFNLTSSFLYDRSFPPVKVDGVLRDGDVLQINDLDVQVFHTPGHSPGSISLLTSVGGLGLLIAGDTVWGGYHPKIGSDLDAWSASLDRLLSLSFDVMTVGHYGPALIFNAKRRLRNSRRSFGAFLDPWFDANAELSS
jgi:hydroxyacylglutathione hydrolase